MRALMVALTILVAGCDASSADDESGGTTGAESSSSSDGASSGGEESSTGGGEWGGETVAVRSVYAGGDSCERACGASLCIHAETEFGQVVPCYDAESSGKTCTCVDIPEESGVAPTHAVSDCYRTPNSADPDGFVMGLLDRWTGGTCDEFCAGESLGACAWVQWGGVYDNCPDPVHEGLAYDFTDLSIGGDAHGDVFRFGCEI